MIVDFDNGVEKKTPCIDEESAETLEALLCRAAGQVHRD